MSSASRLAAVIETDAAAILAEWTSLLLGTASRRSDLVSDADVREQSREFLALLRVATSGGAVDVHGVAFDPVRDFLATLSRGRATSGFSPSETAMRRRGACGRGSSCPGLDQGRSRAWRRSSARTCCPSTCVCPTASR